MYRLSRCDCLVTGHGCPTKFDPCRDPTPDGLIRTLKRYTLPSTQTCTDIYGTSITMYLTGNTKRSEAAVLGFFTTKKKRKKKRQTSWSDCLLAPHSPISNRPGGGHDEHPPAPSRVLRYPGSRFTIVADLNADDAQAQGGYGPAASPSTSSEAVDPRRGAAWTLILIYCISSIGPSMPWSPRWCCASSPRSPPRSICVYVCA